MLISPNKKKQLSMVGSSPSQSFCVSTRHRTTARETNGCLKLCQKLKLGDCGLYISSFFILSSSYFLLSEVNKSLS